MNIVKDIVIDSEQIEVSIRYKGKDYKGTIVPTKSATLLENYQKNQLSEASGVAIRLMKKALIAEGEVKK